MHSGFSQIRLAGDTKEALDMLSGERFRAVLCDVETGPMKGAEFAQAARTGTGMLDPYIPIIMLSFNPTWRSIAQCRDAGANTFLAKPVSNAQLTEKLKVSLTESRRFVRASSYFGPERRKGARAPYQGSERRSMRLIESQVIWPQKDAA